MSQLPPLPSPSPTPVPDLGKISRCCEQKAAGGKVPERPRSEGEVKRFSAYFDCLLHPKKYGCEDGDITTLPVPPPPSGNGSGEGGGGGDIIKTGDDCDDCSALNISACLRCLVILLTRAASIIAVNALFGVMLILGIYLLSRPDGRDHTRPNGRDRTG